MFKFVLLAALCACVLADDTYRPPNLGCAYRIVVTDEDGNEIDYSVRKRNNVALILEVNDEDETTTLLRGDLTQGGDAFCLIKSDDSCSAEYTDPRYAIELPEFDDFEYVDAVSASCPPGYSGTCTEYFNEDDESILVDDQGRLIRDVYEVFYKYLDPPELDVFKQENCEGEDPLPDPWDPCSGAPSGSSSAKHSDIFFPKDLGCAFHYVTENSGDRTEHSVRWNRKDNLALILEDDSETTTLVRGDMKQGNEVFVLTKNEDDDECEGEYTDQDLPPVLIGFQYVGDPIEDEDCPDGLSSDCVKYCEDEDQDSCIIVDSEGRIVQDLDENVYTYDSEVPSLDVFQQEPCEGEDPLPDPVDPCSGGGSSGSSSSPSPSGSHSSGSHSSGSPSSGAHSSGSPSSSTQPPAPSSASFVLPSVLVILIAAILAL